MRAGVACMMLSRCAQSCGEAWVFLCVAGGWSVRIDGPPGHDGGGGSGAGGTVGGAGAADEEAGAAARRERQADAAAVVARVAARRIRSGVPGCEPGTGACYAGGCPGVACPPPDGGAQAHPDAGGSGAGRGGPAGTLARAVLAARLAPAVAAAAAVDRAAPADPRCAARAPARAASSACDRAAAAPLRAAIRSPTAANVRPDGPIGLSATLHRRRGQAARSRRARLPLLSASRGPRRAAPR